MSRSRKQGSGGNNRGTRTSFGSIRKLPSGMFQARYTGPDHRSYRAPVTFQTKGDAQTWLAVRRSDVLRNEWMPERAHKGEVEVINFGAYADDWLAHRQLKPRTRADYQRILDQRLRPTFGEVPVSSVTRAMVRAWYLDTGSERPTVRSHAYALLRTIMTSAVSDELIGVNPVHIRGAGNVKRVKKIRPASLEELDTLVEALPGRYRLLVLLGAWCALRFGELTELRRKDVDLRNCVIRVRQFGELTELRRKDVDLRNCVIRVRRAIVRVAGEVIVDTPKSDAGVRDVAVPPHLFPVILEHLRQHVGAGRDALLFPGADHQSHMAPSSLYRVFYPARERAGRPDLRFHDLRHTGAVFAASTGATLAELMARLGHSTPGAALRYQHAADGRDRQIADALSDMVTNAGGHGTQGRDLD